MTIHILDATILLQVCTFFLVDSDEMFLHVAVWFQAVATHFLLTGAEAPKRGGSFSSPPSIIIAASMQLLKVITLSRLSGLGNLHYWVSKLTQIIVKEIV